MRKILGLRHLTMRRIKNCNCECDMHPRIFFCGEALIDFITADGINFRAATGGSPFNAAKAAAKAGADTSFCGAVSRDLFGEKILADLEQYGVDASFASRSDLPTVLGFIQVSEDDHPSYAFFDRESCMVNMDPQLPDGVLREGDILVIGSISLIVSPGADRIEKLALSHSPRAALALDPNVRPGMIAGHAEWRPRMLRLMEAASIIKISSEDLEFFAPHLSGGDFAKERLECDANLVIVTDGENGAAAWTRSGHAAVEGLKAEGGDTVGAGDTIMGFSLAWLADRGATRRRDLDSLGTSELAEMLTIANTAAALNCESIGCRPPSRAAVEKKAKSLQGGAS